MHLFLGYIGMHVNLECPLGLDLESLGFAIDLGEPCRMSSPTRALLSDGMILTVGQRPACVFRATCCWVSLGVHTGRARGPTVDAQNPA